MSWTKRQFVNQAFEEIGYGNYEYELQPEQIQAAARRLDAMIATWHGRGIWISYPLPSSPENTGLDDETNVPDSAIEAIYLNLALRIAAPVGKQINQETKINARKAYNELLAHFVKPFEMRYPDTTPAGAGNKPWRYEDGTFLPGPYGYYYNNPNYNSN